MLGEAKFHAATRVLPGHAATEFGAAAYQPLGFTTGPDGTRMVPTYPLGLPLHLLAAARIVGWDQAAVATNLAALLAGGGLLWAFARRLGLARVSASAGVGALWLCPLSLFSAMQPMSDLLALTWALATLYAAWRAREDVRWGWLAGFALGVAVLVRPTNLLLILPVLVALGWHWRTYLTIGLGGLPCAALLLFYNWKLYGTAVTTGYGDVRAAFGLGNLPHNLLHFSHWIPVLLSPLVVLALGAPFLSGIRSRGYAVLAAWAVTLTGFYVFYFHSGETWWYLRFILPAFPALILAALAVLETLGRNPRISPGPRAALTALLLLGTAGWLIRQDRQLDVLYLKENERTYPAAAQWARQNLPAQSVVFCMQVSGAFFYYTDFMLLRYEQTAPGKFGQLLNTLAAQNRPVYAALFPFETAEAQARIGGQWTKLATVGQVTFWQRQP